MSPPASCQQSPQALEYLFKFIVQSRILYSRATCGMEEDQFRASIQDLFQSIRFVLSLDSRSSENLVFTQVRRSRRPACLMSCLLSPSFCSRSSFACLTHLLIFFCLFHFCIPYVPFTSELCPHLCPILGLLSDSFGGVISRMPVCGHALRLSPVSVSHSAPLCLFTVQHGVRLDYCADNRRTKEGKLAWCLKTVIISFYRSICAKSASTRENSRRICYVENPLSVCQRLI